MVKYNNSLINLNYLEQKEAEDIQKYLRFNGSVKFGNDDIESLKSFIKSIDNSGKNRRFYNVSYNINRLDKEFDLIKLGDNVLVNIELKLTVPDLKQCIQNYEILSNYYNGYEINIYAYTKNDNKLYKLIGPSLEDVSFEEINSKLCMIENAKLININIDISSVYTEPEFFLKNEYTLSRSQSEAREAVFKTEKLVSIVCGRAGSGKTLLALDLYKNYALAGYKVAYLTPFLYKQIISNKLIKEMNIMTPKDFIQEKPECNVIICDEAQRLYCNDLNDFKTLGVDKIVLIGDQNQNIDSESSFERLLENREENLVINLSSVIRTDDTFDIFARKILGLPYRNIKNKTFDKSKIDISMLEEKSLVDIDEFIFLQPTSSKYSPCSGVCRNKFCEKFKRKCVNQGTTHTVIGKEYNNVLLYFCDGYALNDGKIVRQKPICYGNLQKQLYSLITRSVKKLKIITTDIEIYNFLVEKRDES